MKVIEYKTRYILNRKIIIVLDYGKVHYKEIEQIFKTNHIIRDRGSKITEIKRLIEKVSIIIKLEVE